RFSGLPVVIAGDLMLDHFIFGRVQRLSPEAPVPIIEFEREDFRVGGAGNVAHNIRSLGGTVEVIGIVGPDEHGVRVKDALRADGVGTAGVAADPTRPTTRKARIVTNRNQQVARVDYEQEREADKDVEAALIAALEKAAASARAIVISDYLKGT